MTYIIERMHELEAIKSSINNVDDEIYACNAEGRIVFANTCFRTRNRLEGDLSQYLIYEFDPHRMTVDQWAQTFERIRSCNKCSKVIRDFNHAGQTVWMETTAYLPHDDFHEQEAVWFFSRDISRRIRNEEKVKRLNTLMDTILNNIPVYLFVKDPGNEFRYLYWNRAFEQHSKIPASKALGHTDLEIFPNPADAEKFMRDDLELLRRGDQMQFEEEYLTAEDEVRSVSTCKTLAPTEHGLPLIIGIAWDITEIKNTERALVKARTKAEESDRLKSAFLANMSHEIRTPLNAIVGFSKFIAETDDQEDKHTYADIIESNSELLLQLITDILDISKIEAGTLEFQNKPTNLTDLCREQCELFRHRTFDGVQLMFDDPGSDLWIMGDPNRLKQVFSNLLGNAIKFTFSGEIRYGYQMQGTTLIGYVSDTGVGIPDDKLDTIFERFTKLNDFAVGTGLGLAITKMLIEKMQGRIRVESTLGKGTTFQFEIPCMHASTTADLTNMPTKRYHAAGAKRILIVEDIESNYLLVDALLRRNYRLTWVRTGKDALEMVDKEEFDLILMDMRLPVMDGFTATQRLRELYPDLPVIAMSAFAMDKDIQKAMQAGCSDYLIKPISKQRLLSAIERHLGVIR